MAYNDDILKADASQRELNSKIKNLITEVDGEIYWYIRFNISLDEGSISQRSMKVTDVDGNIIKSEIIYNKDLELIIINPLQKFSKDEYYILHITKKVKSHDKQNLKKNVHILFKIKEGQLLDFKLLEDNIKVNKPKIKLSEAIKDAVGLNDNKNQHYKKLSKAKESEGNKLPYISLKVNPIVAIFGAVIFFTGASLNLNYLIISGTFFALIGFLILILQILKKETKADFFYNLGAVRFNKGKHEAANKYFRKARSYDKRNQLVAYAIKKCLNINNT